MDMDVKEKVPFLTRFFRAVAENIKVPGDVKKSTSETIMRKRSEGGKNGK